ncbi:hemerythrin [Bdellovibrio sp. ZAP7]|uniref:DUF2249 domain-containing protein n=1 Tax=Bdellovibrio sp. ZAP7 TaxID=2231053 RepID=UPI00115A93FD|nr:DUF2249 domain-containing protein [Bdellovibrio sp. ZAP7]QDK44836.1 hemerythrin [Bdellovibrio sp. ZAP7]
MTEFIIEAQKISPQQRHSFIVESFDNLEGGDAIVIVNNHDPLPLLRFFEQNRASEFKQEYIQSGPGVWKVRLTKNKKEGCCGFCGGN